MGRVSKQAESTAWPKQLVPLTAQVNPARSRVDLADDQLVDFVPMAAFSEEFGGLILSNARPANEVRKGYTQFQEGDVLFAKITPCMENGKVAVVPPLRPGVGFGSTEFHVLRPNPETNPKWLGHFLSQSDFRKNAQRNMSGSAGQLRVPKKWLEEQEIPAPAREVQDQVVGKIEELFSDLDAGVEGLERTLAKLKRYRASVLKAAVEGRLTAAWRAEQKAKDVAIEPAAKLLERILAERRKKWEAEQLKKFAEAGKQPPKGWQSKYETPRGPSEIPLSDVPIDWLWSTLGQCFNVVVGATPSRKEKNYWNGDISWVSSGEVQFCRIHQTRETITRDGLKNSSTKLNPKGSVLLGMIGEGKTRGQAAILDIQACNNQNCAAIWVSETPISTNYVYYWLMSQYEVTRQAGSGNNQPALNKSLVEQIAIPLPPLEEQDAIVLHVDSALTSITHAETEIKTALARAARLRQAILKRAFEGRLV